MSEDYWIENDTLHFDDLYDSILPMKKCQSIYFGMEFTPNATKTTESQNASQPLFSQNSAFLTDHL